MESQTKKRGGARPGAGRPRGINAQYKKLSICILESDFDEAKKRAEKAGLSFSKYLIDKALDRI